MCYYFDDIIKFEDFNFDDILIDEKSYEKIFVQNFDWYKIIAYFDKMKNTMPFTIG